MGWDSTKQQALKILGEDADVPDFPTAYEKAQLAMDAVWKEFVAARDQLESKLLEIDNANSARINALQQFRSKVEKSDFKVDGKTNAKKIQQARKILLGPIDDALSILKTHDTDIDELTKHLSQMGKYKQSKSSL